MVRLSALSIAIVLSVPAPEIYARQEGGRVSGWTLAEDGSPLAGVEVVLACPPNPVRRSVSDESGRFDLTNLPSANCGLRATKAGYVDSSVGGDHNVDAQYGLKIAAGIWRDGFELRLTRGVIVSGRIIDDRGEPASNVRVHAIRREPMNGIRNVYAFPYRVTNAAGTFELSNLPPGEYYFGVSPRPQGSDGGGSSGYAITYFPGTTDFAQAQAVVIKPGEWKQLDLRLLHTQAFRVLGIAYDFAGRPLANTDIVLSFATEPKWMTATTRTAANGAFTLTGVQPGRYVLGASRKSAEFGETYLEVVDADVESLIVKVGPRR